MSDSGYDTGGSSHNFHTPYATTPSEEDDTDKEDSEGDNEDTEDEKEATEEDGEVRWDEILAAAKEEYGESSDNVLVEPYLSQFVEHVKNYVEERMQFVKDMEFDRCYESINKAIEKLVQQGYNRKEAVDVAWNDRRFLVKQIMEAVMPLL